MSGAHFIQILEIVSKRKSIAQPNKKIHVLKLDGTDYLPMIDNRDIVSFARAIVENVALIYILIPDRDIGCFKYNYQEETGFTIPCDIIYHIPHDEKYAIYKREYKKKVITNCCYTSDEDIALEIISFWKRIREMNYDYIILHTPILFSSRKQLPEVMTLIKKAVNDNNTIKIEMKNV